MTRFRKIIFHTGPTNSGKSYNALRRLAEAKSGVYCAPLRLLATEVFVKLNSQGVPCDLYIGDDKREMENANHVSCTVGNLRFYLQSLTIVEMLNINKRVEVAVIGRFLS